MALRLGFLSTYPPTACGIATFSSALMAQLAIDGADVGVVRLVDAPQPRLPEVVHQWVAGQPAAAPAAVLNGYDVAVIQHEYGIFGGPDGEDLLDLLPLLRVPLITVLHTVLTRPTPNQARIMAALVHHSAVLVTMTATAHDRLILGWNVDPARVVVIPHGAADAAADVPAPSASLSRTPNQTVLTWGLLSPGKGIEWALLALAALRERQPLPHYRIVGRTHPRVFEREGDAYRDRLIAMTANLGLVDSVSFDGRYLSRPALHQVIHRADLVLLPYDSVDQVTSGVLTEAVAAGKPVISTSFPHAVELLAGGAGLLVPPRDVGAMTDALEHVLSGPGVSAGMAAVARGLAAELLWPAVASRYRALARSLTAAELRPVRS